MGKEEILYDHYKDTCQICRNIEKERNKIFVYICSLLTLLFLIIITKTNIIGILYVFLKKNYDYDLDLSVDIIQSFIWLLLLYSTIRYYQQCIRVEKMYEYIHSLEEKISVEIRLDIRRESNSYIQNYPMVLNFIWILYTIIFPFVYIVLISFKSNYTF